MQRNTLKVKILVLDIHQKYPEDNLNFHIRHFHLLISTIWAFFSMRTARSCFLGRSREWTTCCSWNQRPIGHQIQQIYATITSTNLAKKLRLNALSNPSVKIRVFLHSLEFTSNPRASSISRCSRCIASSSIGSIVVQITGPWFAPVKYIGSMRFGGRTWGVLNIKAHIGYVYIYICMYIYIYISIIYPCIFNLGWRIHVKSHSWWLKLHFRGRGYSK